MALLRKVLSSLEEVKEVQQIHGRMLQAVLKGQPHTEARLPEGACFPLASEEQFEAMELKLADSAFADGVVSVYGMLIGGAGSRRRPPAEEASRGGQQ